MRCKILIGESCYHHSLFVHSMWRYDMCTFRNIVNGHTFYVLFEDRILCFKRLQHFIRRKCLCVIKKNRLVPRHTKDIHYDTFYTCRWTRENGCICRENITKVSTSQSSRLEFRNRLRRDLWLAHRQESLQKQLRDSTDHYVARTLQYDLRSKELAHSTRRHQNQ